MSENQRAPWDCCIEARGRGCPCIDQGCGCVRDMLLDAEKERDELKKQYIGLENRCINYLADKHLAQSREKALRAAFEKVRQVPFQHSVSMPGWPTTYTDRDIEAYRAEVLEALEMVATSVNKEPADV